MPDTGNHDATSADGLSGLLLDLQRHVIQRPDAWPPEMVESAATVSRAVAERLPDTPEPVDTR